MREKLAAGRRLTGAVAGLLIALLLLAAGPGALAAEAPSITATGAVVMDFDTGEFYYEKNADLARPCASMTKLMSVYLVFEELEAGRLSTESYVTAGEQAAAISNDPAYSGLERLRAGESYRVEDLLRLIMTKSCNGSVIALAEHIGAGSEAAFVDRMNEKAAQWGINAHFADACGFEDEGNAVSPRAMAFLARRLITDYPQILTYSSLPETVFQGRTFASTNTLLRDGAVKGIDGLKTGTTNGAGYCFTATALREGRRILSVVMNSAGYSSRMEESRKLLEYGFACREEREAVWAAAGKSLPTEVLSFDGRMGLRRMELYPETVLRVPFRISCRQGIRVVVPAGWYLDGEPVPYFQNSAFRVEPEGSSSGYTIFPDQIGSGEHVLEFRLNPGGLPGVEQVSFSMEFLILDDSGEADPFPPEQAESTAGEPEAA